MMLTQLADVAKRTGYPVVEVPGWRERGRPGDMLDIRTITAHHTANGGAKGDYPSLETVRSGRPGLPGPLAQLGVGVSGTIYVIAAGKCNHAGISLKSDYENSHAIGIEAEAIGLPGAKSDWPGPQMDSYARLCAALVDEFDLSVADVRGHKETCSPLGRKSDPSFDMTAFRHRVAAVDLEADVIADKDLDRIAAAVAAHPIVNETPGRPDSKTTIGAAIVNLEVTQDANTKDIAAIKAEQAEQRKLLAEVLNRLPAR